MGYLDNSSIVVDAILTVKGRELLARGQNEFSITQFALADDEIDYDLWNPDHPLGTSYYGVVIENLPLIEALPDETQMMRYKLVTLPKKSQRIPVISAGGTIGTIGNGETVILNPATVNFSGGNTQFGYTLILSDSTVANVATITQAPQQLEGATVPQQVGENEAAQSVTISGLSFSITGIGNYITAKNATITIIGNETGGQVSQNFSVRIQSVASTPGVSLTQGG